MEYKFPVKGGVALSMLGASESRAMVSVSGVLEEDGDEDGADVDVGRSVVYLFVLLLRESVARPGRCTSSWMMWAWMQMLPAHNTWLGIAIRSNVRTASGQAGGQRSSQSSAGVDVVLFIGADWQYVFIDVHHRN